MVVNKGTILIVLGALLVVVPFFVPLQIILQPVFSDGFESGDFSAFDGVVTTSGETATVVTDNPHSGTYCAQFNADNSSVDEQAYVYKTFSPPYNVISSSMYIRYTRVGWRTIMAHLAVDGNTIVNVYADVWAAGNYRVYYRDGTEVAYETASIDMNIGAWYHVELYTLISLTSGEYRLSIDGVPLITITGVDSSAYGNVATVSFGFVKYQNYYRTAQSLFIDDVNVEAELTPPTTHQLIVNLSPISGVIYTVDSQSGTTGVPLNLTERAYTVSMPSTVQQGVDSYTFSSWSDGSTNPQKTINLDSDLTLTATYEKVTTPSQPGNGFLEVHAYLEEGEVNAQCYANGLQFETTDSGTIIELPIGTYTVGAVYDSNELVETVTIIEDQTVRLDFQFVVTEEGEEPLPWIPSEEEGEEKVPPNLIVQLIVQFIGVSLIVIGGVLMRRKSRAES